MTSKARALYSCAPPPQPLDIVLSVPASHRTVTPTSSAAKRIEALEAELEATRLKLADAEARAAKQPPALPPRTGLTTQKGAPANFDEFFRKLGKHAVCGVYIFDLYLRKNIYINGRYTELLGYTLREINALNSSAFVSRFHPDDREAMFAHMSGVGHSADGEVTSIEYRFRHKTGSWVWCRSYDMAFSRDGNGKMTQFMGSFVEITDVMEAKEAQANFARMAAHDLRAPIRRIRQYVEILTDELGDSLHVDARHLFVAIDQQAKRMRALVDGIRRLTEMVQPTERVLTPIGGIVDRVLDALPVSMVEMGVQTRRDSLPTLSIYPTLIHSVYANLVTNALRHGAPQLDLYFTAVQNGDELVLGVSNNGPEISQSVQEAIFQPFRNMSSMGHGPGLGLPICKRVVELHNGRIWVESNDGRVHVRFTLSRAHL